MDFLSPHFFYGLFALLIPIIIHLFNFRRRKKVYFSSVRFLRKVCEQTSSRRNLKEWLILASRLLFLLFLVLAFTRPYLPAEENALAPNVQIYLDNSLSMTNEIGTDLSAFDQALQNTSDILETYPQGTRFRLITNDFSPFSNRYRDKAEIADYLTELRPTRFVRSSLDIYTRLTDDIGSQSTEEGDIYWISDFQKSTFDMLPPDSTFRVRTIPLTFTGEQNIFIDTLYLKDPFVSPGSTATLVMVFRNTSQSDIKGVNTKVFLNNQQVSAGSYDLPSKGTASAEADIQMPLEGSVGGYVSLDDYPVTFDNEMYFVLSAARRIKIAEIREEGGSNYLEKVFGNEQLFSFQRMTPMEPDFQALTEADLIILHETAEISASLQIQIGNTLEQQGTLLVVPGESNDLAYLRQITGRAVNSNPDSSTVKPIAAPDTSNPFFANIFEEQKAGMAMPESKQWLDWGSDRGAILLFRDGSPYLSMFRQANGAKTYLLASGLDNSTSNFAQHALFLPVMYKIAMSAARQTEPLYQLLSKSKLEITLDSVGRNDVFQLMGNEQEYIPGQYVSGDKLYIELPEGDIGPGFYNLFTENKFSMLMALNHGKNESDLTQYTMGEVSGLFPGAAPEVLEASPESSFKDILTQRYKAYELWPWAIALCLIFLVVEILLLTFMKQ